LCFSWKRKRNHFEQNFCPLHQNQNWTKLRSVYTCDFEVRFHRVFQNLNSPDNAQTVCQWPLHFPEQIQARLMPKTQCKNAPRKSDA
jgi:hypothetical protein